MVNVDRGREVPKTDRAADPQRSTRNLSPPKFGDPKNLCRLTARSRSVSLFDAYTSFPTDFGDNASWVNEDQRRHHEG